MTHDHPPDDDGAVGDSIDYEDLTTDQSVAIGVLAELTAIRHELQGIRTTLQGAHSAPDAGDDDPASACDLCEETFDDVADAVEHVTDAHGAPSDLAREHVREAAR